MKPNFTALWEELWIGWARWPAGKRLARPWTFSCQTAIRNRLVQLRGCPEIGTRAAARTVAKPFRFTKVPV